MPSRWLQLATDHGPATLGEAIFRLAAAAEARHRADDARQIANHLSLFRDDGHEAHGSASQPRTPHRAERPHTEVLL